MRILGVDPGLHITGYGCITVATSTPVYDTSRLALIEGGVIRTKRTDPFGKRLTVLFKDFSDILKDFQPEIIVIEDLYSHYKNPRTAIIMGHARGTIMVAAGLHSLDIIPYSANRIKKSLTGNGHATKEQMQKMIMTMLAIESPPSPDVADALAVALCHANVVTHTRGS